MDLSEAASRGDINALRNALEQGCDVNALKDGKPPLWSAAKSGQADACRFLISRGADLQAHNHGILEVAVNEGHTEIARLLWPHCKAEQEYRSLESAISLGFHEIADFLIETGKFEHAHSQATGTEWRGFAKRQSAAFQQWERFLFVRRGQQLRLSRFFLDYALVLAAKADHNAGLRLIKFLLGETTANPNCMVKINKQFEAPLPAAAEKGNLEILAAFIDHPNTSLTVWGKYNWPAFLHLLASPGSLSTERGRDIAGRLAYDAPPNHFFPGSLGYRLESAFENVLRFGDTDLVRRVIDLVHGAAGMLILPLLIRANEADGVKWVVRCDTAFSSKPPPAFWILLCQYFEHQDDKDALRLFTAVAEFFVEQKTWNQGILRCLYACNFPFMQQFFYPRHEVPPREVIESTLVGLPAASTDQSLMEEWAGQGHASATLWNAVHCGIWKGPNFDSLLLNPSVDLNAPDLHRTSRNMESEQISHAFFNEPSWEAQRVSLGSPPRPPPGLYSNDPAVRDYNMQLMLLEQENKRRLIFARETKKCLLSWAVTSRNAPLVDLLLLSPRVDVNSQDHCGRTPLMHAIAVNDRPTVEKLLNHSDIDLNLPDAEGRTAIFYAAQGGELNLVQLLVGTQKVDFSIRNKNGQTVREFAKSKEMKDVMAALVA